MAAQYYIILGLWITNWVISAVLLGKYVHTAPLGLWLAVVYTVFLGCLISLGDIGWKHWTLICFSAFMLLMSGINIATDQRIKMEGKHIILGLVGVPVFLWLLLS